MIALNRNVVERQARSSRVFALAAADRLPRLARIG
jgi:hypothetical protein